MDTYMISIFCSILSNLWQAYLQAYPLYRYETYIIRTRFRLDLFIDKKQMQKEL